MEVKYNWSNLKKGIKRITALNTESELNKVEARKESTSFDELSVYRSVLFATNLVHHIPKKSRVLKSSMKYFVRLYLFWAKVKA